MGLSVDASNACIPPSSSLIGQTPPLPKTVERGVPLSLHGNPGRMNASSPHLVYPSRNSVVILNIETGESFVYRGHTANVTTAKFSPSGAYVASADVKGKLRVWSFDNEEHLCKLDITALSGPIRDIAWDSESKRITLVGEGSFSDSSSVCTKVIQWDTGVKVGALGQHSRNKASSCAFKPNRPMRIVTGGSEDFKCCFNKGPPFAKVIKDQEETGHAPEENAHQKGSVHCVRYNHDGTMVASVGTDKTVAFYDGNTLELLAKMENVHTASIYSCAFNHNGTQLLTCAADGTAKLIQIDANTQDSGSPPSFQFQVSKTWDIAHYQSRGNDTNTGKKVPLGGMVMGCAFVHGDANIPVAVAYNGHICILSKDDEIVKSTKTGHQAPISSLAMNHSIGRMYTCDSDGVIVEWDTLNSPITALGNIQRDPSTATEEGSDATLMNKVHPGAVTGIACIGTDTVLSIGWDDNVRITSGSTTKETIKLQAQPNAIAKGENLAAIMTVNGIQLMRGNDLVSDLITLAFEASAVCVSANDSTVYIGGRDHIIHIYNVNDDGNGGACGLKEVQQLAGTHLQPIYSLALSNDGTKLASADNRDICVWNVEEGYAPIIGKSKWCFHQQRINALAWSNDDSILASGGNDDSIYFWSLKKKMTRVHYPHSHRGGVTAMEFLKNVDGMVLVSVGNDACVNQWNVKDDALKKFG